MDQAEGTRAAPDSGRILQFHEPYAVVFRVDVSGIGLPRPGDYSAKPAVYAACRAHRLLMKRRIGFALLVAALRLWARDLVRIPPQEDDATDERTGVKVHVRVEAFRI